MRALMANDLHADGRGPFNFLRRHCRTIQTAGLIALAFVLGAAWQNGRATNDALQGQAHYFVHEYAPKVASKAAAHAVKACENGQ